MKEQELCLNCRCPLTNHFVRVSQTGEKPGCRIHPECRGWNSPTSYQQRSIKEENASSLPLDEQPHMAWQKDITESWSPDQTGGDDDVPVYPTAGETIPFHFGDGELELVHVKHDHGEARLYTVVTIDGHEELMVVDKEGMVHSIVCSDEQQLRVLLKTGQVEVKQPKKIPLRIRLGLWLMGVRVTQEA